MGPYIHGVLIFVVILHNSYSLILLGAMLCLHSLAKLSLISSLIAMYTCNKEGHQKQSLSLVIYVRLSMETNKLESIVNSD